MPFLCRDEELTNLATVSLCATVVENVISLPSHARRASFTELIHNVEGLRIVFVRKATKITSWHTLSATYEILQKCSGM